MNVTLALTSGIPEPRCRDRSAAVLVRKYLREQNPHDRSERDRERRDEADDRDQHQPGIDRVHLGVGLTESPCDRQQRQRHARDADREQRLAPQAIDEPDGHDGHDDVDQADEHGLTERSAHAAARLREDRRQVIEDRVDAGDLLKERQAERNQHDEADAPVEQSAEAPRFAPRLQGSRGSAADFPGPAPRLPTRDSTSSA